MPPLLNKKKTFINFKQLLLAGSLIALELCFTNTSVGQPLNVDSVRKAISVDKNDSSRILSMRNLAKYFLLHQLNEKEGLALLDSAEKEARNANFSIGIGSILLLRGTYAHQQGKWANALAFFKEQIDVAQFIKDTISRKKTLMSGYSNIGSIYNTNGDYANALDYYIKGLQIMETMEPDPTSISILHANIATIYNQTNQYVNAEKYLQKMHPYLEAARPDLTALYWSEKMNIAKAENDTTGIKNCIDSLSNATKRLSMSKMQTLNAQYTLLDMEAYYLSNCLQKNEQAIGKMKDKLKIVEEIGSNSQVSATYASLGELYFKLGQYGIAQTYLLKSYEQSLTDTVLSVAFTSAKLLAEIYHKTGDKSKAYSFLQTAFQLNEKINAEEKLKQLNFLEANYQGEKKEKEIAKLTLSNTETELALTKRNRTMWIGGLLSGAIILLMALMYKQTKIKQTIAEQNQKLKDEQIKFLEHQQQVVSLQSMLNGQETERTRIAKDLHDGLGGLFSTVKMYFSTLQNQQVGLKESDLFNKSYEMVDTAAREVRRIAHNMMPEVLMKLGLNAALKDLCDLTSAGKLLKVSLELNGMENRLNASTEIMLYRIVQELLNNIVKHAHATTVIVQFIRDNERLSVVVEDDGRGFNTLEIENSKSAGLENIKSRVNYLNGKLAIESEQGTGTTVMMDFLI